MLNDIKSKNHCFNKARREPIIFRRSKCEKVDILLLFTLSCWIGADDGTASGGDRNSEKSGHGDQSGVGDKTGASWREDTFKNPQSCSALGDSVIRKLEL